MDFVNRLISLPVLSVRQPWASYLVSGLKSMELRTWSSQYRGWLWIHTGKKPDSLAMELLSLDSNEFYCGGLVGVVKLEECQLIDSEDSWTSLRQEHLSPGLFMGPCYGWRFSDALSLSESVECLGELGLFRMPKVARERVNEKLTLNGANADFLKYASDPIIGIVV